MIGIDRSYKPGRRTNWIKIKKRFLPSSYWWKGPRRSSKLCRYRQHALNYRSFLECVSSLKPQGNEFSLKTLFAFVDLSKAGQAARCFGDRCIAQDCASAASTIVLADHCDR
jgi:hypothetical protein